MNFRKYLLHLIVAFVLFPSLLLAQHQRRDRIGLGVGANFIINPINTQGGSLELNTGSSFSFSGQYYKTVQPHLDLKGGLGWQGSVLGEKKPNKEGGS
jgi:hypothetical protein